MNRRGFLQFLGMAAIGAAAEQVIPHGRVWSIPQKVQLYTIEQYADYVNISDLMLDQEILTNVHRELAYRMGMTIQTMMKTHQDLAL